MTKNQFPGDQQVVARSLEVTIKVGLALGLVLVCFFILKPFILLILWGIIIAVSVHPLYRKLGTLLGNRHKLAAILFTLFLLIILITPIAILGASLVDAVIFIKNTFEAKQSIIPAPVDACLPHRSRAEPGTLLCIDRNFRCTAHLFG